MTLADKVSDIAKRVEALEHSLQAMTGIVEATFPSLASPSMRAAVEEARKLLKKPEKQK